MKKILTLTVGICALNEENGIQAVIKSVLSQVGDNFRLKKIYVISDGSTDRTVERVMAIKDKRLLLVKGKTRKGMNNRLNQIFSELETDVLIKLDADILPTSPHLISRLIAPFSNPKVGYVSGKLIAVSPKSFIEKSINSGRFVWDKIRDHVTLANKVYCCAGPVYAISRSYAEVTQFPKDVWADIGYLYFNAISHNFKFKYVPSAQVWIHPPTTFRDHVHQITRYRGESKPLYRYFPKDMLDLAYNIPIHLLIKYKFMAFIKSPVHTLSLLLINTYAKYIYTDNNDNVHSHWNMITSSKKLHRSHN